MKSIWYNGVMMRMFIDNPAQKKSEAAVETAASLRSCI